MRPLWNINQVAEQINIPKNSIRGKVARQEIPHVKIGRRVFFVPEVIEDWVKQNSIMPRPRREAP
jgi:excisionase family DNA binding protein